MTATVGTTTLNTNKCVAINASGVLSITGYNGTTSTSTFPDYQITIPGYTASTTSYTIDTSNTTLTLTASYNASLTNVVIAHSGSVTFTSTSATTLKGTFNFVNTDGTKSTGSFTAKL